MAAEPSFLFVFLFVFFFAQFRFKQNTTEQTRAPHSSEKGFLHSTILQNFTREAYTPPTPNPSSFDFRRQYQSIKCPLPALLKIKVALPEQNIKIEVQGYFIYSCSLLVWRPGAINWFLYNWCSVYHLVSACFSSVKCLLLILELGIAGAQTR